MKRGAKQQLSTVAFLLAMALPEDTRRKMMGWVAQLEAEQRLDQITPESAARKLKELMPDEATHFVDRILDPEILAPDKPPKGAAPGKQSPPGGRPSKPRVAS